MALNKEKVTAAAMKHLQKGALDKAVREYEKILEVDPKDERTLQKVGDLYFRMGFKREALNAYRRVSQLYTQHGFYLKAIAVTKQILELEPENKKLHANLAEMYQQLGLLSETIQQYQLLVEYYKSKGQIQEMLDVLKKITLIDPNNLTYRIHLAEGYAQINMKEEAKVEYEKLLGNLKRSERQDDYIRVLDRLVFLTPEMTERGRELASIYLDRGETRKGLSRLKAVLKQNTEDTQTLSLLAKAFESLGQFPKAITVYREMARIYKEVNDQMEMKRVYKKLLLFDPDDKEAKEGLSGFQFETGVPGSQSTIPDAGESRLDELQSISEVPGGNTQEPSPSTVSNENELIKLMTEAEVFVKYGLHDQAEDRLKIILNAQPDNKTALMLLKDVSIALDDVEEAVKAIHYLGILYLEEDRTIEARQLLDEALQLEANHEMTAGFISAFDDKSGEEMARIMRDARGGGPEASVKLTSVEKQVDGGDDELIFDDPEVDFEQESGELQIDDLIYEDQDEESSEPDIIEEVELPAHLLAQGGPPQPPPLQGTVTAPPLPAAATKPPALSNDADIDVSDEFDAAALDELLIDQAINETDYRRPPSLEGDDGKQESSVDLIPDDFSIGSAQFDVTSYDTDGDEASGGEREQSSSMLDEGVIVPANDDEEDFTTDDSLDEILDLGDIEDDEYADDAAIQADIFQAESIKEIELEPDDLGKKKKETQQDKAPALEQESAESDLEETDPVEADSEESQQEEAEQEEVEEQEPEVEEPEEQEPEEQEPEAEEPEEQEPEAEEPEEQEPEAEEPEAEEPEAEELEEQEPEEQEPEAEEPEAKEPETEEPEAKEAKEQEGRLLFSDEEDGLPPLPDIMEEEDELLVDPGEIEFEEEKDTAPLDGEASKPLGQVLSDLELEEYEEARFFYEQAIYSECIEIFKNLLSAHPKHPLLLAQVEDCRKKQAEEELHKSGIGAPIAADTKKSSTPLKTEKIEKKDEPADGSIDLSEEILSNLDMAFPTEAPVPTPEATATPVSDSDTVDTHLNLGLAYREMGMLDEAIGEFLTAEKKSSSIRTLALLGLCYLQKQNKIKTLEFFKKALSDNALTRNELKSIRYDIGSCYMTANLPEAALRQFSILSELDSDYRDVSERIEQLEVLEIKAASPDELDKLLDKINLDKLKEGSDQNNSNISYL